MLTQCQLGEFEVPTKDLLVTQNQQLIIKCEILLVVQDVCTNGHINNESHMKFKLPQ